MHKMPMSIAVPSPDFPDLIMLSCPQCATLVVTNRTDCDVVVGTIMLCTGCNQFYRGVLRWLAA